MSLEERASTWWSPAETETLVTLVSEHCKDGSPSDGMAESIAARLGRTTSAVRGKLHRLGMPSGPSSRWPIEHDQTLIDQWQNEAISIAMMGKQFSVSRATVEYRAKVLKLGPRPKLLGCVYNR